MIDIRALVTSIVLAKPTRSAGSLSSSRFGRYTAFIDILVGTLPKELPSHGVLEYDPLDQRRERVDGWQFGEECKK